jgi:hypothetical protein
MEEMDHQALIQEIILPFCSVNQQIVQSYPRFVCDNLRFMLYKFISRVPFKGSHALVLNDDLCSQHLSMSQVNFLLDFNQMLGLNYSGHWINR